MSRDAYESANGLLAAARDCGVAADAFRSLPGWRADNVLARVLNTFTTRGARAPVHRWIWEDLREPRASVNGDRDATFLLEFAPSETRVWLFAEGSGQSEPPFWIFEGTLGAVVATLNNHHLLEFFVVANDLSWLVGENHHGVWFGSGAAAPHLIRVGGARS